MSELAYEAEVFQRGYPSFSVHKEVNSLY